MGDSVQIPWELANRSLNPMDAAAAGLAQGQRVGALNALHGLDLDNPDSLNRSLQNSARVGALDQANALMNLSFIRNLRSSLPSLTGMVSALGNTSQPAAAAAAPPSPTAAAAPQTADLNGYQDNLKAASGAIDSLLQTPQAERPAKLAAIKQDFLSRGVPEQAIDAAVGSDLSDAHLESLKAHFGDHADYAGSVANPAEGATPPAMPAAHPSNYGWSDTLLQHPELQATLSMYKAAGIDFTPLIETARTLQAPQIAEQAKAQYAQQIQLAQNVANLITGPTRLQQEATGAGQKSLQEKLVALGFDPEIARRTTAAQEAARAPYNPVSIPTPTGAPAVESSAEFAAQHGGPAVSGGMGPQVGASPAQNTVNVASANQLQNDRVIASNAQAQMVPLRKVYDLLPATNTGPGTQVTNTWRSFVISQLPVLHGLIPGGIDAAKVATANTDELKKYMTQISGAAAAQYGQGTNEKLAVAASGNANPDLSNLANRDVTRMNIALLRAQQAKIAQFDASGQAPESYSQWSAGWARHTDPRAFMLDILSKGERAKVLATIKTAADKRAFLAGKQAAEEADIFSEADIPR